MGEQPVIVIGVKDITASVQKAEQAGAAVAIPLKNISGVGLYAWIKDTEGNVVGLWQNFKNP